MARIVNPYNLDDDDDAVFSALLSQGLIWIEDDEHDQGDRFESEIKELESFNGIKVHILKKHGKSVNAITVSGDFAISASSDKTLCVWNWRTGECLHTLKKHGKSVNAITVSGDFAISASSDKTLCVWNWRTGECLRTLSGYTQEISALDLDGEVVVSVSYREIWVWNWQTGELFQKLIGSHSSNITSIAVDGDFVLSVSHDLLLVRNWKTGEILHKLRLDNHSTKSDNLGITKDFAIFSNPYSVDVWDWKNGKHLDESDFRDKKNIQINTRAFLISYNVYVYSRKISKWCSRHIDYAYDKIAFAEDYSHIIASDHGGWVYVVRINSSLKRIIASNINSDSASTRPNTSKSKTPKKASTIQRAQRKSEIVTETIQTYSTYDVVQAACSFIEKRNEEWVNFSRVSQHLHQTYPDLKKNLRQPNKSYKNLLQLLADHPSDFELRQDTEKQGLYWIRLKQTR